MKFLNKKIIKIKIMTIIVETIIGFVFLRGLYDLIRYNRYNNYDHYEEEE